MALPKYFISFGYYGYRDFSCDIKITSATPAAGIHAKRNVKTSNMHINHVCHKSLPIYFNKKKRKKENKEKKENCRTAVWSLHLPTFTTPLTLP